MYMWRERIMGNPRIDTMDTGLQPLDEVAGFKIRPGFFRMNGAYQAANGVSFTIHSFGATSCTLLLFHPQENEPYARIPFPETYHIGNVYSILVKAAGNSQFGIAGCWSPWSEKLHLSGIAGCNCSAGCSDFCRQK